VPGGGGDGGGVLLATCTADASRFGPLAHSIQTALRPCIMHERAEALGKAWNDLLASVSAIAEAK
jgi:hypothetical protein